MTVQLARTKEVKDRVVVLKLAPSLVHQLDAIAATEGLTRSAVIRRAVMHLCAPPGGVNGGVGGLPPVKPGAMVE